MNVNLISWTRNPLETVAFAASMCYDSEPSRKIIKGCIKSGHTSVLEHANYTFEISGVSRSFLAQITRHRHASYSVQSQRYVCYSGDGYKIEFVYPRVTGEEQKRLYESAFDNDEDVYNKLIEAGANPEDARAVLCNAMPTKMVVTMNLRAMMNFMNERLCNRAQKEIKDVAQMIKNCVIGCPDHTEEDVEIIKSILVPKCERFEFPFCPEYKCCGRHKKLSDIYKIYTESSGQNLEEVV